MVMNVNKSDQLSFRDINKSCFDNHGAPATSKQKRLLSLYAQFDQSLHCALNR